MNVPPRFRVNKATAIMCAKAMLGAGDYLKGRYVMQCPKCGRTAIEALRQDMVSDEIALKCKYWKCGHVFRVHLLTPAMIEAVELKKCFIKIMEVLDESLESFEQTIQTPASPLTLSEQYHIRNTLKSYIKIQEDAFAEVPK